jgi:hypothetical protein
MRTPSLILLVVLSATTYSPGQRKSEDFRDFIHSYVADSVFQRQRTYYPLPWIRFNTDSNRYDTTYVAEDEWTYGDFGFYAPRYAVQMYDNFERVLRPTGQRVVSFEGLENGINMSLYFKLTKGKWYLVKVVDLST